MHPLDPVQTTNDPDSSTTARPEDEQTVASELVEQGLRVAENELRDSAAEEARESDPENSDEAADAFEAEADGGPVGPRSPEEAALHELLPPEQ